MIIKLLLILSLFYRFTIHSQTNKGLESLEERGEFVFKLPGHFDIEGETNPTTSSDNPYQLQYIVE